MFFLAGWLLNKLIGLFMILPGSLLLRWLCTPRGYRYALPATLLVVPYAMFGYWLYAEISAGNAQRWLLPIVMLCAVYIFWHLAVAHAVLVAHVQVRIELAREARRERRAHADIHQ